MTRKKPNAKTPHERLCKICNHVQREEIEKRYLNWDDIQKMATEYKVSKDSIWTHASATGLSNKRAANKSAFLNRVMERSNTADKVNTSDGISAAKLDAQIRGELIEKSEVTNKFGIDAGLLKELKELGDGELKGLIELLTKETGDNKKGS